MVYWTESAQADLNSIIDYISDDNISIALDIFEKIKIKCDGLKKFPEKGRVVSELKIHNIDSHREIIISPWRIIYRDIDFNVFIISVFDGRRNMEDILLDRILRD